MFNPYCMATKPVLITQKLGRAEDKATGGWKRPLLCVPLHTGQQQQGLAPEFCQVCNMKGSMVQILTTYYQEARKK